MSRYLVRVLPLRGVWVVTLSNRMLPLKFKTQTGAQEFATDFARSKAPSVLQVIDAVGNIEVKMRF